jgi:HK97 gp10 family phage protein
VIEVKVHGLRELGEFLTKRLPAEIASKNGGPLITALRASGRMMRDEAKRRVPVKSARLQEAISMRRMKNPPTTEGVQVYVKRGRSKEDTRGAFYAAMVEYGTIGGDKPDQAPQPYMRPTFEAKKIEALDVFWKSFARNLKAAERKAIKQGWNKGMFGWSKRG